MSQCEWKILKEEMRLGSPASSDRYVVYTVDAEDSSSGVEESHVTIEEVHTPQHGDERTEVKNQPISLRYASSDLSFTSYWSKREKCCCMLNLVMVVAVVALASVFIVYQRNNRMSSGQGENASFKESQTEGGNALPGSTTATLSPVKTPVCITPECVSLSGSILSRMDTGIDPCTNFYGYACGGFIKNTYLDWDRNRVRENPDVLINKYNQFLSEELSSPVKHGEINVSNKLRSLYKTCREKTKLPKASRQQFATGLLETLNVSLGGTETTLTEMISSATRMYGASPFFKVMVDKRRRVTVLNKFSDNLLHDLLETNDETIANFRFLMPSDFYYRLLDDNVFNSYKEFIRQNLIDIFGQHDLASNLIENITDVMKFEIKLQKLMYNEYSEASDFSNCNNIHITTLQGRFSFKDFSWLSFLAAVLGPDFNITSNFTLCRVELSSSVFDFVSSTDVSILRQYVILHTLLYTDLFTLLSSNSNPNPWSSSIYRNIHPNNSCFCADLMQSSLPLSSLIRMPNWKIFENTADILFSSLKAALIGTVKDIYWMPSGQRDNLVRHVDAVTMTFEWSPWKPYTTNLINAVLDINEINFYSAFNNVLKLKHAYYWKGLRINSGHSRDICIFNSRDSSMEITPSAMMDPLFYSQTNIPIQFGSTGATLATTLAKAFDIDALLNHYMTGVIDIRVAFTMAQHLQCLTDTFKQYTMQDSNGNTFNVRGDLTKGQTFRDTLSLLITYEAFLTNYKQGYDHIVLPGLNMTDKQLLFLSYAQTLCEKTNSKGVENYYIGENASFLPHSIRINGAFSNFRRFSSTYGCVVGQSMNPIDKCVIF